MNFKTKTQALKYGQLLNYFVFIKSSTIDLSSILLVQPMPQPPVSSTGTGNNLPAIFPFLQADSKAKACVGLSNVITNF